MHTKFQTSSTNYAVFTRNSKEYENYIKMFIMLGARLDYSSVEEFSKEFFRNYPWIGVLEDNRITAWMKNGPFRRVTIGELINILDERLNSKKITVALNDKYTAVVSRNCVVVDCQEFPLEIIDRLAKAKAEVLDENAK